MLKPEVKEQLLYLFKVESDWEEKVLTAKTAEGTSIAIVNLLETRQTITRLQNNNELEESM